MKVYVLEDGSTTDPKVAFKEKVIGEFDVS